MVTCCEMSAKVRFPSPITKFRRCKYTPTMAMVHAVPTDLSDATNVLVIDDIVSRLDNLQTGPPKVSFPYKAQLCS
jgi:hypothetical protein